MGWFVTCPDPQGNEFGLWQTGPSAPGTSEVDLAAATRPERHQLPSATLAQMRLEFGGLGNRGQRNSEQIISWSQAINATPLP
jgi:hypothetical protein